MSGSVRWLIAAVGFLVAAEVAVADDSFRCGSKIISVGMSQAEVVQYCGEPSSKAEDEQAVRSGNRQVGKTTVYRWTYTSYSRTRVLVFDQDRLVSIE